MKKHIRLLALLLAGVMALSLCACTPGGGTNPSEAPSADASPSPSIAVDLTQDAVTFAAGMAPTDIVLTVNGDELPADQVLYWLGLSCSNFLSQYGAFGIGLDVYGGTLLDDTVTLCSYHALLRQKAGQLGCLPTDAQAQAARDAMLTHGEDYFNRFKALYGLTDRSAEYFFLSDAYYDNVRDALTHIPDELELDEYLDAQGVFSVKHILLKTTDSSDQPLPDGEIAEKRATAEDLLAQLQAADDMPAKFDELMHQYSEDPGLAASPDGYTYNNTHGLVGGFREAALALKEGELSGIVETDYGYHIMLRLTLTEEQRTEYAEQFRDSALTDLLGQWLEDSEVVRAPALEALDVADWFNRLVAYQQAFTDAESEG